MFSWKPKVYQLSGKPLFELAKNLSIPIEDTRTANPQFYDEEEVRRRIANVYRSKREHRLWIVALVSAIASAISASAAWAPIILKKLGW